MKVKFGVGPSPSFHNLKKNKIQPPPHTLCIKPDPAEALSLALMWDFMPSAPLQKKFPVNFELPLFYKI